MEKSIYILDVICNNCGKLFQKRRSEIVKSKNNYCSRSCAAKVNNKVKKSPKENFKQIKCYGCKNILTVKSNCAFKYCDTCKDNNTKKYNNKKVYNFKRKECVRCNINLSCTKRGKYCLTCKPIVIKEISIASGQKSAAKSNRRSKNEIYFHSLCQSEWDNITCNEPFFDSKYGKWDADVILHTYKIAVLWNGIWHYKQVRAKHSLLQVQARDKIKIDSIISAGYTPYVIKDLGKYNKKFVEEQFIIFKQFINCNK